MWGDVLLWVPFFYSACVFAASFLQAPSDRPYYAYLIEASSGHRFVRVERRYSQFLALHNEVTTRPRLCCP